MKFLLVFVLIFWGLVYILWPKKELMIFKIMSKDKIFMVTIHVVAGVLMIAVCWTPAIVGDISVWNKLFCTAAIILLLRFHYWCQQYEP